MGNRSGKAISEFWGRIKQLEPWRAHPIWDACSADDLKSLVGLNIHIDGAEFYRDDEFWVYSMSSVFAGNGMISDVLLYKFPIAIFAERDMDKEVKKPNPTSIAPSSCLDVLSV